MGKPAFIFINAIFYSLKASTILTLLILLTLPAMLVGQHYYRIKADFSFKYKGLEEKQNSLVMGTAYYDKIAKKITYRVKFPKPQVWVMHDTSMYKFENKQLVEKSYIPSPVETSIFNLALESSMHNFALEASSYTLENVEEEGGMVISTWAPPRMKGEQKLGKVLIANQDGQLKGIVFQSPDGQVIAKQFYEAYVPVSGIFFPQEVTHILFDGMGKESYQITSYKNIVIDETGEDYWYRYPLD